MKAIKLCAECADYDMKKHRCRRGAVSEADPRAPFYDDCPLPEALFDGTLWNEGYQAGRLEALEDKWIPVTERLPEENDRYLCNVKSFAFPGCSYHAILHYDKHDGFREGNIYTDDVTHWMPLPEPPKEVGE